MPTVGGFLLEADEDLEVTTDATGATWQGGFLRSPVPVDEGLGKIVVTTSISGASMQGGFLRAPGGALVVEDAEGTMAGGFERTASGALAIEQGSPGERYGLKRSATGRILVNGLSAFSPISLAPAVWFDASDLLNGAALPADSSLVDQWSDKSGNTRHATQATTNSQPAFRTGVLNGLPVVRFDGSNDSLGISSLTGLLQNVAGAEMFVVASATDTGAIRMMMVVSTGVSIAASRFQFRLEANDTPRVYSRRLDADAAAAAGATLGTANGLHLVHATADHAAATVNLTIDAGATASVASGHGVGNTSNTAPLAARIGSSAGGATEFFPGDIAEIILVPRVLTAGERSSMRNYLTAKWGL